MLCSTGLTSPFHASRLGASCQVGPEIVHPLQALNGRDEKHGRLVQFIIATGTPFDAEERLIVPFQIHPRDHVGKEIAIVSRLGRVQHFG